MATTLLNAQVHDWTSCTKLLEVFFWNDDDDDYFVSYCVFECI